MISALTTLASAQLYSLQIYKKQSRLVQPHDCLMQKGLCEATVSPEQQCCIYASCEDEPENVMSEQLPRRKSATRRPEWAPPSPPLKVQAIGCQPV